MLDKPTADFPISECDRRILLERHGTFALAYSVAFQPGLQHFGDADGFLSYRMVGRTAFVLADPLAPPSAWGPLIDAFIARKKDVTFWQASHALASLLDRRGFCVNELGYESTVPISDFSFLGPKRRSFRTAVNRFERRGLRVCEVPFAALDPGEVRRISDEWRHTRTQRRHELGFLARPVVLEDEPGVRKFFILDRDNRPLGFAFFDPVYECGRVVGYLSTTRRWPHQGDPLSAYFLVRRAIEQFRLEGVQTLYLGLMPFAGIEDKEFTRDWLTRRAFKFIDKSSLGNRLVYPTRTLALHKKSYDGALRQTYCAMNTTPSLPRLLKLLVACRIF